MPEDGTTKTPLSPSLPNSNFIVQSLFPSREVHLIVGPSGAGKTTLVFQMIEDWAQGKPIFGYESYPRPFVYVPCDRSDRSTRRTLDRCGVKLTFPTFSLVSNNVPCTMDAIILNARKLEPKVEVLFIDAIGTLVPNGKLSDYGVVANFLRETTRRCQRENLTVIGMGHSAKTKEGEQFSNPRQRCLGSVAWGGFADTMILIEPESAEDANNPNRDILLLPRNSPDQKLKFHFDSLGRLVDGELADAKFILEEAVSKLPPGEPLTTEQLLSIAQGLHVSERTLFRWIGTAVDSGVLQKVKKGVYRRPHRN